MNLDIELRKRTFFVYVRTNVLETDRTNLALALGVSNTTVINIENGKLPVSRNMFLAIYVLLQQYKGDHYLYFGDKATQIDKAISIIRDNYLNINYLDLF